MLSYRHVQLALLILAPATWASAAEPLAYDASALDAAIRKSLPLLEASAAHYTTQRDCFSCHHQALPAMAVSLARERDYSVDVAGAAKQAEFTLAYFHKRIDRLKQGESVPGGPFTAGYALIGLHAQGCKPDETTAALVAYLLKTQEKDGSWHIRTHRPPLEDSNFTATALSLRGIQLYAAKDQADDVKGRVARAQDWLVATKPETNEDRTMRLLGLKWSAADAAEIEKASGDLLAQQREDGGWAQKSDMSSDAYATGQALYALHHGAPSGAGGLAVEHTAYRAGVAYLVKTQQPDGSWLVATRSKPIQTYFESGFPHGKSQFISICGTSWSTMVLIAARKAGPGSDSPKAKESRSKP
jgi:N-acyl-D-amino-acid deacylase